MLTEPQLKKLTLIEDPNHFLKELWQFSVSNSNTPLTYSSVSKRAGLKSRSYLREIFSGKRKLSNGAIKNVITAFSLRGPIKTYFKLISSAQPNASMIEKIRARIQQPRGTSGHVKMSFSKVNGLEYFFPIYAALGSKNLGSTFEQIRDRILLPDKTIQGTLDQLVTRGYARYNKEEGRFFPIFLHLSQIGLTDEGFNKYWKTRASINSKAEIKKNDTLFISSVSISNKRESEFKQKLQNLLLQFVDNIEDEDGDQISEIQVYFGRQKF